MNAQDWNAWALTAQALAHAYEMLQDAGHRAGGSTPDEGVTGPHRQLVYEIHVAKDTVRALVDRAAKLRDAAKVE